MNQSPTSATATKRPAGKESLVGSKMVIIVVLVLVAIGGGFVGGMQYQKGKGSVAAASTAGFATGNGQAGSGGFGGRTMNGSFGNVTAISSSSITVSHQSSGSTKTYSISSSTTIRDGGSTVQSSDIIAGERVMVQTGSSTSTEATQIRVNPTMGGGPGEQQGSSSSATSSTN